MARLPSGIEEMARAANLRNNPDEPAEGSIGCPQCGAVPYCTERGRREHCGKFVDGGDGGYV
jgi:hypothetical protein